MKIIISGAAGFLGKNLLRFINKDSFESIILLDTSSGISELAHLHNCIDYCQLDVASEDWEGLVNENDIVVHLAWRSNPSITGVDLDVEAKLNWEASLNVIHICAAKKAKLVFVSSGGTVYGESEYLPIDEKHPTNPISAYGRLKLKVEKQIIETHSKIGLTYLILRPSNLYGPGFSTKKGLGVIGHWVEMVKCGRPVQIVGSGNQVRDFIHVEDLCRGILSSLRLENEILNISSGDGVSLNTLRQIFEELIDKSIKTIHLESRVFDVKANFLSNEKIKKETEWRPLISLREGIKGMI